jgi:GDP-L-fucose synthase
MPTNLYGPNDNYDLNQSHVLPALLRKMIVASRNGESHVEIWGSGKPMREFLHVDDLAEACYFLMNKYNEAGFINIGTGTDLSINSLAELIKEITGFKGELIFNTEKPDGTPKKLLDCSRIHSFGWKSRIDLRSGIEKVFHEIKSLPF